MKFYNHTTVAERWGKWEILCCKYVSKNFQNLPQGIVLSVNPGYPERCAESVLFAMG
jgi:hypothetical protein